MEELRFIETIFSPDRLVWLVAIKYKKRIWIEEGNSSPHAIYNFRRALKAYNNELWC